MAEATNERVLRFGPFRLLPDRQALLEGGRQVRLGGRAFDILRTLAERGGELVPREQLIDAVWPGIHVDDSALRVHIAALRKALGDGQDGNRYIVNVPGRGYRFAAPIAAEGEPAQLAVQTAPVPAPPGQTLPAQVGAATHLPALLARMVGRVERLRLLGDSLAQRRFVSLGGAGGIGKTTVAVALAESLADTYAHGAHFADLGAITDGAHLPAAIAASCGLALTSSNPAAELLAALRTRCCLVLLDNCEHLIEAVAPLAEAMHAAAPGLHLLATSREPLRAAGEWVHRSRRSASPPRARPTRPPPP